MRNTVDIAGVPVDNLTMESAVMKAAQFLSEDRIHVIYTPNAEIMMEAHRNPELKNILSMADMLVADGAGVVLASKILGRKLPERVAGFDLTKNILSMSKNRSLKIFLFGGKPEVAKEAGANIIESYPGVEITGFRDGYFNENDEDDIIERINSSGADILLVGLGAPKQEKWIHKNRERLKVRLCIGVGGSIDVFAGKAKRAPEFFRKYSLEWLYRLYKEPWRYKRMMDLPRFVVLATMMRLTGN
ncbi:MAG TPA: WecB/TagA/CpsF family glycosyltransferase [Clostridia bacterium]